MKTMFDLEYTEQKPPLRMMTICVDDYDRVVKENRELQRQATEAYQIIRDQIQEIRIISERMGRMKAELDMVGREISK